MWCDGYRQKTIDLATVVVDGPTWLSFLALAKDRLWRLDLFSCESIQLRRYWVLVVIDVFSRRLVGFGVERAPIDGLSVCRMLNREIVGETLPKRLSTDHDPLFRFHRWLANLRVLEIEEIMNVPHVPFSHPFVECRSKRISGRLSSHRGYRTRETVDRPSRVFAKQWHVQCRRGRAQFQIQRRQRQAETLRQFQIGGVVNG